MANFSSSTPRLLKNATNSSDAIPPSAFKSIASKIKGIVDSMAFFLLLSPNDLRQQQKYI
jgi:hypothetical protein